MYYVDVSTPDTQKDVLCDMLRQCLALKGRFEDQKKIDAFYKKICAGEVVVCFQTYALQHQVFGFAFIHIVETLSRTIMEVHDVFVVESLRNSGLGRGLMESAIAFAQKTADVRGEVVIVSLTSKPSRSSANRLYIKLGFTVVSTAAQGSDEATNLYYRIVVPQKTGS
jgi:GNAT superfamily N-acetyltransferase